MTEFMADQKSPSLARAVALDLLEAVLRRGRPLDDAIPDHSGFAGLDGRDRAFARLLAATTLRRLGQIDAVIDAALERPLPRKALGVRDILRLGTVQLLFLDTPPHAAVTTAVDLAQARKHGPHKKLVNAILRRLDRQGRALAEAQDAPRLNTPDWLWEAWVKAYGEPSCRRIAEAHLSQAPLDITVKEDAARWAKNLDARILPTGSLRRPSGGTVTDLPGFREGAWWVQDAAAALPVNLLGDIKGRRVVDLCAAPGGKTAQLANRGAVVTAVDRSENVHQPSDRPERGQRREHARAQRPVEFRIVAESETGNGLLDQPIGLHDLDLAVERRPSVSDQAGGGSA